jgi:hypothetical protein
MRIASECGKFIQEATMRHRWRALAGGGALLLALVIVFSGYFAQSGDELRLVVDLDARELYVYEGGARTDTYPIAVGQEDHETPTGEFTIHKIDWNPDWTPPDSEWAEGREKKEPGEDGNPMGRVRMIYRAPYSIHGTEDLESLGRAASHGSLRLSNADIIALAKRVMAAGGEERSESWYREVLDNPTRMYEVELSNPVPLENRGGSD